MTQEQLREALYTIDIIEINRVLIDEFIPVG